MSRRALRRAPESYNETFVAAMASAYLDQTPWTRVRLSTIRDLVEPRQGDRVLDLGCAAGAVSHFLSTFGCETVGVDSEARAIEAARSAFPRLKFESADVSELPFPDSNFDKAVAADLVEHLDNSTFRRMLLEVRRVLSENGTLSLYTPNPAHVIEWLKARDLLLAQNPTHIGLRRADELVTELESAGYAIERAEWRASFIPGFRLLEAFLAGRSDWLRYRLCIRARR